MRVCCRTLGEPARLARRGRCAFESQSRKKGNRWRHAPLEGLTARLGWLSVDDVEDLDGTVEGTRGQSYAVVVELRVVLEREWAT